jgi:23S rRNA pseudouridine1911/1915/1917 synthase
LDLVQRHIALAPKEKERLSDYLVDKLEELPSRKSVKKAIKYGLVFLNGEIGFTGDWVSEKDIIELYDKEFKETPFELKLHVEHECNDYAIVLKPAGLKVSGNDYKTLQNALTFNLQKAEGKYALKIPRPAHRLDVPTSGLVLVAKTYTFLQHAFKLFENREIEKKYVAIVQGEVPLSGKVELDIEGKTALSLYERIKTVGSVKNEILSWVELSPKTGRTHQLRIHMASLSCPIVGDKQYATEGTLAHKGLFLAAVELSFKDLDNELKTVRINPPDKFIALWNREGNWSDRVSKQKRLKEILLNDQSYDLILEAVQSIDQENCWLSAGFVRNKVWDVLHDQHTKLDDVDVIYLNHDNLNKSEEEKIEERLRKAQPNIKWSVKNQARMGSKHGHGRYVSIKQAMSYWPETATSIAVRLNKENSLDIISSYGLDDLFNMIVRPSVNASKEVFENRLELKQWTSKWKKLTISS